MAEQSIAERLHSIGDELSLDRDEDCRAHAKIISKAASELDRLTKERDEARQMLMSALQWFEDNRVALQRVGPGTLPTWVRDGRGVNKDTANG